MVLSTTTANNTVSIIHSGASYTISILGIYNIITLSVLTLLQLSI
nr:MAG TPA: hypothetical protein [Caudoviricetes sp.]